MFRRMPDAPPPAPEPSRQAAPRWLRPGFLGTTFVAFMFTAAIIGSHRGRPAELAGNPYWEEFAAFEEAGAAGMSTIGVWRHDRKSFEEPGVAHCGLIVRAVGPGTATREAEDAMRAAWAENGGSGGTAFADARLGDAFCGRAEMIARAFTPDIQKAWANEANPRFLRRLEEERTLFAGVFDLKNRRVYTWLSVRGTVPPPP